ncbi:unnamed protein product, partial [Closterium sp. NIES-53]
RRIGLVMEVARTSMIHADAPHFLWPFAVRYAAHQLKLWPRVSLPETSPTLRFSGEVGDASVFRVWGSCAFVRDTSADKLSAGAISCVFLGFPPDAPGWQFYHPTSRRVFPSKDVTFDELVPFYRLFPYRPAPVPPSPLFLALGPPPVNPLPPQGPAPSGVSQVDPLPGTVPIEVAINSGAARGAASGGTASGVAELVRAEPGGAELAGAEPEGADSEGAGSGGAEPGGAEPGGAEPAGAEPGGTEPEGAERGGAESEGAESGGAEPRGTASSGGPLGASPRLSPRPEPLSPQQLREWFAQRTRLRSGPAGAGGSAAGGTGAGGVGATRLGGAGVTTGAGGTGGAGAASPGGARTGGTGSARTSGVGGVGARGAGAGDPGAGGAGAGGTRAGGAGAGGVRARDPGAGGAGAGGTRAGGTGAGSARAGGAGARDTEAVDPGARDAGTGGAVSSSTGAGGTMQRRPFFVLPLLSAPPCQTLPQLQPHSPLPAPSPYAEQKDSFTERREPESRPASPFRAVRTSRWVPRPRPPLVPSTYVMALRPSSVPMRVPLPPPPESSLLAVPDPESDLAHAAIPTVSCLLATVVTDPSFESTATSALVAELVEFAAACHLDYATALVARSDSARPPSIGGECSLGTDVLEDRQEEFECLVAAVPYLVSMLLAREGDPDAPDIPTPRSYAEAIIGPYSSKWQTAMDAEMASLKSTGTYINEVPPFGANIVDGMWIFKWSLRRPVYGLRQAPREWLNTVRTTLVALGFAPSTSDLSLFLRTDTSLPPFYVRAYVDDLVFATADTEALALVLQCFDFRYSSPQSTPLPTGHLDESVESVAPPSDESVEPSGPYPELVGCLMYLMTYTGPDLAYPLSILARYVAPGRHRLEHREAAKRVLCYLCSTWGMGLVL